MNYKKPLEDEEEREAISALNIAPWKKPTNKQCFPSNSGSIL